MQQCTCFVRSSQPLFTSGQKEVERPRGQGARLQDVHVVGIYALSQRAAGDLGLTINMKTVKALGIAVPAEMNCPPFSGRTPQPASGGRPPGKGPAGRGRERP